MVRMMPKAFSYRLGASVGERAQLGLIVLQTDETLEYDLRRILPGEGVALYTSRVASAPDVSTKTLAQMEQALPTAAGLLPPAIDFDAVGYGCTSGSAIIGAPRIAALIRSNCRTAIVTDPLTALIAACSKLSISRLAFLSPYVEDVSARLRRCLADADISTPHFGSFDEAMETNVARIDGPSVVAAAIDLYRRGESDAVFLSCTNLQSLDVITEIEAVCDCPVLSSNLVLGWHMLEQAGLEASSSILSRLLGPDRR